MPLKKSFVNKNRITDLRDTMAVEKEQTNKALSLGITTGIHVALLLIMIFLVSIKPPNPPLPDYGVAVNFGIDDSGFGDVQGVGSAADAATASTAAVNQPVPESAPDVVPTPNEVAEDPVQTGTEDSPVAVNDQKKDAPVKPVEKPGTGGTDRKTTPPTPATGANTSGGNNNGDKPGTVGDMGKPTGDLSNLNYRGNGGSGSKEGASLQLNGWRWDDKPSQKDPFNETGRIVFQIKVDADGNIQGVSVLEKTVSPEVVNFYRKQVEQLSFSKTKDNVDPAPISTGKVTFIISGE